MTQKRKIKMVWLSANLLGYQLLREALKIKDIDINGIITLEARAKTKMYDGVDKKKWYSFGIPVYEIENINEEVKLLKSLHPDIIIMCGWRQIINKEVLNLPKRGMIGFHPTLLPEGRGPAPIINTILEGFKKSGITMFYVSENLDQGDIIGQKEFKVGNDDYAMDIYYQIIRKGKELVKEYLPLLAKNKAPRFAQKEAEATYFQKRSVKDNEIKLEDSLEEIYRKIRAFSKPYNGAHIKLGNNKLIIWKAELKNEKKS